MRCARPGCVPGETVAIFGVGGLGISAMQLAKNLGAAEVFARRHQSATSSSSRNDSAPSRSTPGRRSGRTDSRPNRWPRRRCRARAGRPCRSPCARPCNRSRFWAGPRSSASRRKAFEVAPYSELLNKEAEIIGVSDHLASEIPMLLELARAGKLDLSHGIIRTVPLEAARRECRVGSPRGIRRRRPRRHYAVAAGSDWALASLINMRRHSGRPSRPSRRRRRPPEIRFANWRGSLLPSPP